MRKALMLTAATYGFLGGAAYAQDNPLANRPQDPPPILQYFTSVGLKMTSIGQEGGINAYLLVRPDGKMQTAYITPDGKYAVVGLLTSIGGVDATALQLEGMKQRFEDAKRQVSQVNGVLSQTIRTTPVPGVQLDPIPVPLPQVVPSPIKPEAGKQGAEITTAPEGEPIASASVENVPMPFTPVPASVVTAAPLPVASVTADESRADQWVSTLDKGMFIQKVKSTAWFSVGFNAGTPLAPGASAPPELFMVADPQCVFCHSAWETLGPMVKAGKLTLNVILIAGLKGSEPKSLSILSRQEPGKAWYAGEGSERGHAIAPPPATTSKEYRDAQTFLAVNHRFALDMKVEGTPFFAYVSRTNGKLYIGQGPHNLSDFLAAL